MKRKKYTKRVLSNKWHTRTYSNVRVDPWNKWVYRTVINNIRYVKWYKIGIK